MFIQVKPGLKIRDPHTKQFIPDEGAEVPDGDFFWQRLINDGDVIQVQAAEPAVSRSKTSRSKE